MTVSLNHQPLGAAALLGEHQRRVDLIGQCANEASKDEFQRKWMSVLSRCAEWFSSMPLSPDLHREPGGAFRCTIETAFYAMRLAGGQKFGTNLPSEKRRRIEPQYNYAVFLAAVCSRLDEPYRHFVIERETDRAAWNPSIHGAAGPWLGSEPYRVARRETELPVERMRTGMLAQILVGSELLAGLDAEVLAEMFGAINPNMNPLGAESLIHKVIRQAIATAAEFDRKAQRAVFEPVQFEVPSAIHVAAELQPSVAPAPVSPASPSQPPAAAQPEPVAATQPAAAPAQPQSVEVISPAPSAPAAPRSLLAAIGYEEEHDAVEERAVPVSARPTSADQMGLPFVAVEPPAVQAVNPADMRVAERSQAAPVADASFDEVLKGAPNMIRDLFRALREDVASGRAKVQWSDTGLAIQKRLIGSYGVASDTLVEHLRRRSLLLANGPTEITLAPRAGQLIVDRPA
ncbi:TraI domain-containing protein [Paraburkholderia sp. BL10I2N1]|uniref:TraI domain-containing protein n=1 Tax=Paraburkholderia sp. BL10I2N1 TaxID=1938796 RepID=UPI0010F16F97|nr:TraI domain-containing protein [Paraburkholderia sp. BL10I2N1]TDN59028.1 conjugal transfer pilus assembly protein TraI [Paraburkholderia sp. BL10I2N1]